MDQQLVRAFQASYIGSHMHKVFIAHVRCPSRLCRCRQFAHMCSVQACKEPGEQAAKGQGEGQVTAWRQTFGRVALNLNIEPCIRVSERIVHDC